MMNFINISIQQNQQPIRSVVRTILIATHLTLLGMAVSVCSSRAQLVTEDFSYGTGSISGANGGTGWSGAWGVAGSGNSLIENVDLNPVPSGYAYDVVPNALRLNTGGNTQEANRSFAIALSLNPDVQTTYYFSTMLARVDTSNGAGTEGVRLLFGDALLFGFTSTELPSITHLPSNTTVTGTPAMTFTNTLAATPRYLLLGKMVANPTGINDEFYFSYFNSTDNVAVEPAQWQVSLTSLDLSNSLGSLKIQTQNFAENTYWDNFYLGTTYASVVNNNVFDVAANESITISEVIDGTSALTKTGLGQLTLTGDNTYTGSTTVSAGTLQIASTGSLGGGSYAGAITNSGSFILSSDSNQLLSGMISGVGTLTKSGEGTLTLTANNSYSGGTSVTAGKLLVNGAITNSAVTVQNGGVLGGGGAVGATAVLSGGTIAPGESPGTLTNVGSLTWSGGGSYDWEIFNVAGAPGTDWDLIRVTDQLLFTNLSATNTFNINIFSLSSLPSTLGPLAGWNPLVDSSWTILSATNGISGFNAANFTLNLANFTNNNSLNNGLFSLAQDGGDLKLMFTAASGPGPEPIPEPGTWVAAALLACLATYLRRRARLQ
jgi:autotransporter-associated beta strand protein